MQQGINGQAGFSQNFESVEVLTFVAGIHFRFIWGLDKRLFTKSSEDRLFLIAAFLAFFVLVM
jgi:hypothetical protein